MEECVAWPPSGIGLPLLSTDGSIVLGDGGLSRVETCPPTLQF